MSGKDYKRKLNPKNGGHGRPRWVPTPEQRKMAEAMAAIGMTHREMGIVFEKNRETIEVHFGTELKRASTVANARVGTNLFKMTTNNVRAAEFWLTNRDPSRWKNRHYVDGKFTHEVVERPDLSGLTREQLAILRQAAAIMRLAKGPVINGEARALPGAAVPQEDPEDVD